MRGGVDAGKTYASGVLRDVADDVRRRVGELGKSPLSGAGALDAGARDEAAEEGRGRPGRHDAHAGLLAAALEAE